MNNRVDIQSLICEINKFVHERGWEKHHTPRNIATSVAIESAGLLEHFQWDDLSYDNIKDDEQKLKAISYELADVIIYLLRLIHNPDLDFEEIVREKIIENGKKYPSEKC